MHLPILIFLPHVVELISLLSPLQCYHCYLSASYISYFLTSFLYLTLSPSLSPIYLSSTDYLLLLFFFFFIFFPFFLLFLFTTSSSSLFFLLLLYFFFVFFISSFSSLFLLFFHGLPTTSGSQHGMVLQCLCRPSSSPRSKGRTRIQSER